MPRTKVFGIGFQKTGTTTLGAIFDQLGYRTASYHPFRDLAERSDVTWEEVEARALPIAADHDSTKDTPWPLLYRFLDREFPGSKFIHVVRDPAAWIASAVGDFKNHPNALHTLIYGVPYPQGHEEIWLERYRRHNAEVEAYFADRPDDYIQFKLEDGIDVRRLCEFLGEEPITLAPPVANTKFRKRVKMLWWRSMRRMRALVGAPAAAVVLGGAIGALASAGDAVDALTTSDVLADAFDLSNALVQLC